MSTPSPRLGMHKERKVQWSEHEKSVIVQYQPIYGKHYKEYIRHLPGRTYN